MKIALFLIALFTLTGYSTLTPASPHAEFDTTSTDPLEKMIGVWEIEGRIRGNAASEFTSLNGTSKIEQHLAPGQLRESFELGGRFKGEVFLNYSKAHDRYELFQIDVNSSNGGTLYLVGDVSEPRLKFKSIEGHPQWGFARGLDIRWEYVFNDDGTFKHEIYLKDPNGEFFLQSDYKYKKAEK